ncbi:hypothetical protein HQ576_06395 [bacterium]|nr:hypothetical protein [bacterium]
MHITDVIRAQWQTRAAMVAAAVLVLVAAAACRFDTGTGSAEGAGFQKVTPSDRTFSFEDFTAVGFKRTKQYDVEGLPGAEDAWFGFWRVPGDGNDPVDYEVRVYASHEDAVEQGTALAEEVTGEDAILDGDLVTWKEDIVQIRSIRGGAGLGEGESGRRTPRYGDFAILGNLVPLCEGSDSEVALENCAFLAEALGGEAKP